MHGRGYRFVAPVKIADRRPAESVEHKSAWPVRAAATPDTGDADWPLVGRYDELELVQRWLAGGDVSGVLITGPDRVGKTRLAEESVRWLGSNDEATARVNGLTSTAGIPFGAIAHLVSPEVFEGEHASDELARAAIFRRAHAELEATVAERGRLFMVIDEIEHLDELTSALLSSLMQAGTIFGIVIQRSTPQRSSSVFDDVVRSSTVRVLEVQPLDETDIDVILYRVLEGPIDRGSLRRLGDLSKGRPGLLRDLVESSRRSDALVQEDGVWRLVGPATSTATASWPPSGLTTAAVRAAEMLALLSGMDLDDAVQFFGAGVIDELDAERLLALDVRDDGVRVNLADPLLAETMSRLISPLHARRHRTDLLPTLLERPQRLDDFATAVTWARELGRPIAPDVVLAAAKQALRSRLDATAEALVESLGDEWRDSPDVVVIRAELSLRRGQWERAEDLFGSLELDRLDETSVAFVLRQRAWIHFSVHRKYDESIALLRTHEEQTEGRIRAELATNRLSMLGILGYIDEALDPANAPLADLDGESAVQQLCLIARAHSLRGNWEPAIATLNELDDRLAVAPKETVETREAALAIRLGVLLARGDIDTASSMVRDLPIIGRRTLHSWLPLSAAEVELAAGRPRAACELIRPLLERRHQRLHFGRVADAFFARAMVSVGDHDDAERRLRSAYASVDGIPGYGRWLVTESIGDVCWGLGRGSEPISLILDVAAEAGRLGALRTEAELLALAAAIDDGPTTASRVAERLVELATKFGGRLWPITAAHVQCLAAGGDLDAVADDYAAIGYRHLAEMASGHASVGIR